jgi:asparagine synthase (glutamine-hydrolysing)
MIGISIFSNEEGWENSASEPDVLFSNSDLIVTHNSSYQYPICFEKAPGNIMLIFEGKVYDRPKSNLMADIKSLITCEVAIERYLFEVDGEFYLYLIDIDRRTVKVFGDHLNRLPLFYGYRENKWAVSRDIGFVRHFLNASINKLHLAEFLVFDYNLGDHTLFNNVFHLQISKKLKADLSSRKINAYHKTFYYDFSQKHIEDVDDKLFDEMASIFLKASKYRASQQNILSLSGGMDSRSVAAALCRTRAEVTGVTFEDEEKSASEDVVIAQEIAQSLDIKWKKVRLSTDNFHHDVKESIRYKLGIQPARYYFLNQFCRKVRDLFGTKITFFTGDGGDKVFPDLSNGIDYHNDDKLFRLIIKENYEFPIAQASKLTGIPRKKLKLHIKNTIAGFPGKNSGDKHEYFVLTCRMKRYIFEGEDRNRRFFWSTNPFLSKPFFELMMKIGNTVKQDGNFYKNFVRRLDKDVAQIRNENYSSGKISVGKDFYQFVKDKANSFLTRKYKERLKALFEGRKSSKTVELYKTLIQEYKTKDVPLDLDQVEKSLRHCSMGQLSLIATTLMVSQYISKTSRR